MWIPTSMPWLVSRSHSLARSSRARVDRIFRSFESVGTVAWLALPASASHCHRLRCIVAPPGNVVCLNSHFHPGSAPTLALPPRRVSEVRRLRNHITPSQVILFVTSCVLVA